ncbi:uncharacterized protein [Haliotis cracherodii]|uniref:uncharacterized protein n=1 Tax=Haliotis cracherodii TaxID=6455 RepID=UPI0039E7AAB4
MAVPQVFILAVLGLLYLHQGEAIQCYACSSMHDFRCADDFRVTRAAAQQCTGSCVKYRGVRPTHVGEMVEITRGCMPQQSSVECRDTQHNGLDVYGCTCNTDYCNNSLRMSASISGVFVTALLALLHI